MARNNVKVTLNSKGCAEILNSSGVASEINSLGRAVGAAADAKIGEHEGMVNPNIVVKSDTATINGTSRPISVVVCANPYSINHNAKYNTLLKSAGEVHT